MAGQGHEDDHHREPGWSSENKALDDRSAREACLQRRIDDAPCDCPEDEVANPPKREGKGHACQPVRDMHDIFDWIELRHQAHRTLGYHQDRKDDGGYRACDKPCPDIEGHWHCILVCYWLK